MKHLSPAAHVVSIFNGVRATARAIGRTPGSVSKWRTRSGGNIPSAAQRIILVIARARKLDITPDDLAHGRRVAPTKK